MTVISSGGEPCNAIVVGNPANVYATEDRMRILRLIENMTLGRNAVGYLTESMHGAGSPQAQRIQISRQMQIETKKRMAKGLAGIASEPPQEPSEQGSQYLDRVFRTVKAD